MLDFDNLHLSYQHSVHVLKNFRPSQLLLTSNGALSPSQGALAKQRVN